MKRALAMLGASVMLLPSGDPAAAKTSERFCEPVTDYFEISFVVAVAADFAELGADEDLDAAERRATMLVGLSPKLVELTEQMIATGPKAVRKDLRRQLGFFRQGVGLLRDAGASDEAIEAIAEVEFDEESDPTSDITRRTELSRRQLEAAGRKYVEAVERFDATEPSAPAAAAFDLALSECGILPDTRVECADLLDEGDVSTILGAPASLDGDQGCVWETAENADGDISALAVDVYASTRPYRRFLEQNELTERVPGLGDQAVAVDGFSSLGVFKSCGRTVVVRTAARTLQIALCRGDRDVAATKLAPIAERVLARI